MSEEYVGVRGYTRPSPEQQRDLIERVKTGDVEARETFVRSNMAIVFSVANKYFSPQDRDDAYQEGAIKLWKLAEKYDPQKGEFSTLAVISLKRRFRDMAKTEKRRPMDYVDADSPELANCFKTYDAFKDTSLYDRLCDEVRELPLHQRAVISFHYGLFDNKPLPFDEIGRRLNISGQMAWQHEKKAMITLRERLQKSA
jgi:RNA polymerase sigma factor (sigma-70 family)